MNHSILILSAFVFLFSFSSCSDDGGGSSDGITAVNRVEVVVSGGGAQNTFVFATSGGNITQRDDINLSPDTDYDVQLRFFNGDDLLNEEILRDGVIYLTCFDQSAGLNVGITYADQDGNGKEIGLATDWTTFDPASGELRISFRNQLGIKPFLTNTSCDQGQRLINATFTVNIQ